MRTRPWLLMTLALALVACKSEKKADDTKAPAHDTGEPAARLDAGAGAGTGTGTGTGSATDSDTLAHPFFYKVSKDGKSVYFLGSIHMGVDPKRLPQVVWDAEKQAKTFAMETDISNPFAAAKAFARTDGTTLEAELGPEYWKKLDDELGGEIPGGAKMMNGMKAALPATLVEVRGMPETAPIDTTLLEDAKAHGAELVYLEPLELQLGVLTKWFDARVLKYELDHLDEIEAMHGKLIEAYVSGDEAKVEGLDEDNQDDLVGAGFSQQEIDQMQEDLLYGRNAAWIEPLEKLLANGDAFVVVGVAHLLGERSVLDLLAKAGYTVERITP